MSKILIPDRGAGKELREHIERLLNLPPLIKSFTLTFKEGEAVVVICEFYPQLRQYAEDAS